MAKFGIFVLDMIVGAAFLALMAAKTVPAQQAAVPEPPAPPAVVQPEKEYRSGYEVVDKIGDTDVCLLINGIPTWVTIIDEYDCDCDASVDWDAFDAILEELDPLPPVPDVPCEVQR